MLKSLLKKMPSISDTERAALEAGTVWLDGELFSGKPDLKRLLREPYPELTDDEQAFLDGPVVGVCSLVDSWKVQQDRELPPEVWAFLKNQGFFGLRIPKRYGGKEFSQLAVSAVFGKLASSSGYLSTLVLIPNSVGPAELLLDHGTPEQKDHYLPRLAMGDDIPCFALTEPDAGSDAAALGASGTVYRRDDGRLMMRLNWHKRYITLAPVATLIGLAFRLRDPEELLGKGPEPGITVALIPASTPGVDIGRHHDPLGLSFPNGPIRGHKVVLPVDTILGGQEGAGQGWKMLMEALSGGRAVSLPAQATAGAKWTARVTGAYVTLRRQFDLPLARFEGIQEPLARIAGQAYLMEAARVFTCGALDAGHRPAVISALVKYNLTELARRSIQDGMDILGGAGICRGPHNLLAEAHIASPVGITVEGANILTRTLITFGQGLLRSHPFARRELEAAEAQDRGALRRALLGHGTWFCRNLLRSGLLSLTRGRWARSPVSGPTAKAFRRLSWASARFALLADLALLVHGSSLKRRGRLSGRFADALSWIYLGLAALRRFEAEGRPAADLPLVLWATEEALGRIQKAFEGILGNFGAGGWGFLLRGLPLAWTRLNALGRGPSDSLGRKVAERACQSGDARERLSGGLYLGNPGIRRLEEAFAVSHRAAPVLARLEQQQGRRKSKAGGGRDTQIHEGVASGLLSEEEADLVLRAWALQREAMAVDEFSPQELRRSAAAGEEEAPTASAAPRKVASS